MNRLFQLAEQRIELDKIRRCPIQWSDPVAMMRIINETVINLDDELVKIFDLVWNITPDDDKKKKGYRYGRYLQSDTITCFESTGMDGDKFIYCRERDQSAPMRTVNKLTYWLRTSAWGIETKDESQ